MNRISTILLLFLVPSLHAADWPTVRGNPARTGTTAGDLRPPFRLAWAVSFNGERFGSVVEPVVADGRVFVGTHQGSLYALDSVSGKPLWRARPAVFFCTLPP